MTDSQRATVLSLLDAEGPDPLLAVIVSWLRDAHVPAPLLRSLVQRAVSEALQEPGVDLSIGRDQYTAERRARLVGALATQEPKS